MVIPNIEPPNPGRIKVSLDWGQTDPNAICSSTPPKMRTCTCPMAVSCTCKGDIIFVDEIYTATKPGVGMRFAPYEIADKIKTVVARHEWNPAILRANGNPADGQIFDPGRNDARASTADDFEKAGIIFERADKSGCRARPACWSMLMAGPSEGAPREQPAIYICGACVNLIRSLPNLQRDPDSPDDVNSDGGDHCYDCARYAVQSRGSGLGTIAHAAAGSPE